MKAKCAYFVSAATFILGFFSFISLGFLNGVLFSKEIVDIPIIYNISVMIGDSILLPIINFKVFNLLIRRVKEIKMRNGNLLLIVFLALGISLFMNLFIHQSWVNDSITDFIAFTTGKYSIIGVWHLVFSTIQLTIFLIFIVFWFFSIRYDLSIKTVEFHNIWFYIFAFTLLGVVDMFMKYFFIFEKMNLLDVVMKDRFAFVTPLTAIIVLFAFSLYRKSTKLI